MAAVSAGYSKLLQTAAALGVSRSKTEGCSETDLHNIIQNALAELSRPRTRAPSRKLLLSVEAAALSSAGRKRDRDDSVSKEAAEESASSTDSLSDAKVSGPIEAVLARRAQRRADMLALHNAISRGVDIPASELSVIRMLSGLSERPPRGYKYLITNTIDPRCKDEFTVLLSEKYDTLRARLCKREIGYWDRFIAKIVREGDRSLHEYVEVRYVDEEKGYGLFAKKKIPAYTPLGIYTGKICRHEDVDVENKYVFGFNSLEEISGFVIDGDKQGNMLRFVNTSRDADSSNVVTIEHISSHGPNIIFVVQKKAIEAGEEMMIFYGEQYLEAAGISH